MHRTAALALALVALVAPLAACGGDDDTRGRSGPGGASLEQIRDAFIEQGAPEDEAACVAKAIEGQVSLEDVASFGRADDPEDIDPDVLQKIGLAVADCLE